MKIKFLGTGAADWKIKQHKGIKGFRRNSSILIDDCLLIDPNPDVMDALDNFQISSDKILYILNTHKHNDHYSEATIARLQNATFYPMIAGEISTIGNYTVTALLANHKTCMNAVHFLISDGNKTIFYGLDGAWLTYEEFSEIKRTKVDFAILDGTVGNIDGDYRIFEHNNLNMVLEMKKSLLPYVSRFCISHMARTLHTDHEELAAYMKQYDIDVAYDGYEVIIS